MNRHPAHSLSGLSRRVVLGRATAVGLALALGRRLGHAAAQAVGVTAQLMGTGQPASAPGLELTLRRITIAPDGRLPAHSHPGSLVFFVESGTSGYTVLGGTAQLTRAATDGTPTPAETIPVGTETILNPGDWVFVEDPQDDARNAGTDDLVLLIAGLTRVGEPFTTLMGDMDMGATPTS